MTPISTNNVLDRATTRYEIRDTGNGFGEVYVLVIRNGVTTPLKTTTGWTRYFTSRNGARKAISRARQTTNW